MWQRQPWVRLLELPPSRRALFSSSRREYKRGVEDAEEGTWGCFEMAGEEVGAGGPLPVDGLVDLLWGAAVENKATAVEAAPAQEVGQGPARCVAARPRPV